MVESCSGITGSFGNVQWYAAPGVLPSPDGDGDHVDGYWSLASNRIVLVADDTLDGGLVRHEMLHALVRVKGHPRSAFLQSCGGVVRCGPVCVSDAGPITAPDSLTPRVTPAQLEVSTEVSPAIPSSATDRGFFTFTITVRNPFPHPVVALMPPGFGGAIPVSYPYEIQGRSGRLASADRVIDPGVTYFARGETKRNVLDIVIAQIAFPGVHAIPGQGSGGIALSPGTYTLRGGYSDHWAPDMNVVVNP
jgi:hypothetical protein